MFALAAGAGALAALRVPRPAQAPPETPPDVPEFTMRTAETWSPGVHGADNGLVVFVFPASRRIRVEVGYGLEPELPDALVGRLVDAHLVPNLREGRYLEGVEAIVPPLLERMRAVPPDSLAAFAQKREGTSCTANLDDGFWSAAPYFGFRSTFKYEAERAVLDKYTIVEETRTRAVHNWPQYFHPETLRAEITSGGLEVEELLGDVAGAAYDPASSEFAVIARSAGRS